MMRKGRTTKLSDGAMAAPRCAVALVAALTLSFALAGCKLSNDDRIYVDPIRPAVPAAVDPEEKAIGEREHPKIVATYGGVYENSSVERRLATIVGKLVAASEVPSQSYSITILDSSTVNAFALPGGYLYVTRGLLTLASDASEVAAVLAHEIAHVTTRHALERENRAKVTAVASQVVHDVLKDTERAKAKIEAGELELAQFSRAQELEADQIGVRTIARAGYDPFAAARFLTAMDRFAQMSAGTADSTPDFLSSHPTTPERVRLAVEAARQFGAPGYGTTDKAGYQKAIDGMIYGDDPREGYILERAFIHPGLGITFDAPAGYTLQNTAKAVLGTAADDTAMRFDSVALAPEQALTDYLASGWMNGLQTSSVETISVNGLEAATALAQTSDWAFRVAVVRNGTRTYRFIFAARTLTPAIDGRAMATVNSFRRLTPTEAARIRPQRIRLHRVAAGENSRLLAAMMKSRSDPYATFLLLNGLDPDTAPEPGSYVKLVTY